MSVLSGDEITKPALLLRGFIKDGWGSPHMRQTRNTTMYELVFENDWDVWSIKYFPPEFEGQVTPGGGCVVDMRGKVMMQKETGTGSGCCIIDVTSMMDIEVFIKQVLRGKVKPFKIDVRKMFEAHKLKV